MKTDIRNSVDTAMMMENFLILSNQHWTRVLFENKTLDDVLVVEVAEVCNVLRAFATKFGMEIIPNLSKDLSILGETGMDKELEIEEEEDGFL